MKFVLLLWITLANQQYPARTNPQLEVIPVTFTSIQSCEEQLKKIKSTSEDRINGMCVQGDK